MIDPENQGPNAISYKIDYPHDFLSIQGQGEYSGTGRVRTFQSVETTSSSTQSFTLQINPNGKEVLDEKGFGPTQSVQLTITSSTSNPQYVTVIVDYS